MEIGTPPGSQCQVEDKNWIILHKGHTLYIRTRFLTLIIKEANVVMHIYIFSHIEK